MDTELRSRKASQGIPDRPFQLKAVDVLLKDSKVGEQSRYVDQLGKLATAFRDAPALTRHVSDMIFVAPERRGLQSTKTPLCLLPGLLNRRFKLPPLSTLTIEVINLDDL